MFCLSNVHVLPFKRARLERKITRKKVCAERLLANGNETGLVLIRFKLNQLYLCNQLNVVGNLQFSKHEECGRRCYEEV